MDKVIAAIIMAFAVGAIMGYGVYPAINKLGAAPADRVDYYTSIKNGEKKICIDGNFYVTSFTDTNSMLPSMDKGHNGINMNASEFNVTEIQKGDIISFRVNVSNTSFGKFNLRNLSTLINREVKEGVVAHRVVNTGYDSKGWYAKTRGDNLLFSDPGKVREDQVRGVMVGVIY